MAYIGIEIGGTKLQLCAGTGDAGIADRIKLEIDLSRCAEGIREAISRELPPLAARHGARAIGVGFGGPVDWKTGKVFTSHQVGGWSGFDLKSWLESISGLPVRVDNDANVAALGEARHGAGQGYSPVFYATLGSGVGGGLVVDDRIYHGVSPGECELGHLRLDKQGVTVESRCSGWAADAFVRAAASRYPESALARLTAGSARGEARFLPEAIAQGDPHASEIMRQIADDLAFGLSHVTHLFHPRRIILGGGLSNLGEGFRGAVEKRLGGYLMKVFLPGPELVLSALKEDAVPMGALCLAGD